jgi:hypothetical protein
MDSPEFYARRRLQVVADADPGAIARVVERFQNLNIIPRRLTAEFSSRTITCTHRVVLRIVDLAVDEALNTLPTRFSDSTAMATAAHENFASIQISV